jgi:hypothetical protein
MAYSGPLVPPDIRCFAHRRPHNIQFAAHQRSCHSHRVRAPAALFERSHALFQLTCHAPFNYSFCLLCATSAPASVTIFFCRSFFNIHFAVVKSLATPLSHTLAAERISFPWRPPVDGCVLVPELPVQQTLTSRRYSDSRVASHAPRCASSGHFYGLPIAGLSVLHQSSFETPITRGHS